MITKTSPISFKQQVFTSTKTHAKSEINNPNQNKNIIYNNPANFSLINFTSGKYLKTLEDNYFKLPSTATPDVFQKAAAMNILEGNDVVVTAPTGTGKTAIALYAISKNMEEGRKTFYTTPLKALSNEKFKNFQKIFGEENVGLLTGDNKINPYAPIVIMTTEVYRNMVLASRFAQDNPILDNLKTVIFDESHYLGDADRGGIWEQSVILSDPNTQMLSLSATIGNNKKIANWMAESKGYGKAEIISGQNRDLNSYTVRNNMPTHTVLVDVPQENRHVPLDFEIVDITPEQQKTNRNQRNKRNKIHHHHQPKDFSRNPHADLSVYNNLIQQLNIEEKLPAIFFVFSKRNSRNILSYLAKHGECLNSRDEQRQISDIISKYQRNGHYLGESLHYTALKMGYAIHNAGLLPSQKELVEELFNKKLIKVVIATETLSAGINMPARTTVITSDKTPSGELTPNKFHQMAGRAGRRGIDTQGYCIAMAANREEYNNFENLINSPPNDLTSTFKPEFSFVANYYSACHNDDLINELLEKSFYAYDNNPQIKANKTKELKQIFSSRRLFLRKHKFINSDHELLPKGILLSKLNGYEQIPIINAIFNRKLEGLDPIELAAAVGTMANLRNKLNDSSYLDNDETYFHENQNLTKFVNYFNNKLINFNSEILEYDKAYKECELDTRATSHLYEWAKKNFANEDSIQNWQDLYYDDMDSSLKSEGCVFREITTTADLLKQMQTIAKLGYKLAKDANEAEYYQKLSQTINASLNLICRPPAEV